MTIKNQIAIVMLLNAMFILYIYSTWNFQVCPLLRIHFVHKFTIDTSDCLFLESTENKPTYSDTNI